VDGIPDFLPKLKDSITLDEEEHWDNVAQSGRLSIMPNKYINSKIYADYRLEFERCLKTAWPQKVSKEIRIAEIGCGTGSAIDFFDRLEFETVYYIGIDLSMKTMQLRYTVERSPPASWKVFFFRTSANKSIFKENSLDIVFSASALHHLDVPSVMEWISKSLKPNGLLILHEPNNSNTLAKLARKFARNFHTKGEKPILPKDLTQIAYKNNLVLVYEKGLHYFSGSLQYLMGILRMPSPFAFCVYQVSRVLDNLITSPVRNYSFVQVYRKTEIGDSL